MARPGAVASTLHDLLRESVSHMRALEFASALALLYIKPAPRGSVIFPSSLWEFRSFSPLWLVFSFASCRPSSNRVDQHVFTRCHE